MSRLPEGSCLVVLQACKNLRKKDETGHVLDTDIAEYTNIKLEEVRDCLMSLYNDEWVHMPVRLDATEEGLKALKALITPKGKQVLRLLEIFPTDDQQNQDEGQYVKVIPSLNFFDKSDAENFLKLLPDYLGQGMLPESIKYWKSRIEETDAAETFRVGVIYGPSGCGKTSLVKAGLLPRLSNNILTVPIEATPDNTEPSLLTGIRWKCPDLPKNLGLVDSLAALHRGEALPAGKKLLLVLDQFEQWLLGKRVEKNTELELVKALRHCDGNRVQAIIMLRDEYYGPTDALQRELGIVFRRDKNTFRVEPFIMPHAMKVLAAFGRGSGKFQKNPELEQMEFINQAVEDLAVGQTVMPVRLALFAQMFKGREWSPEALRDIGGTEKVGFVFLNETFDSRYADPRYVMLKEPIKKVLKVLLPENGMEDIRGKMKPHRTLLEASGYDARDKERAKEFFEDLLRVLNEELRLITPTDPEGLGDKGRSESKPPEERYYGFDLRLMPWGDGSGVPTSDKNLVIVGTDNNGLLHIRIFDANGNRVANTDETKLPSTQTVAISTLKQQLPALQSRELCGDQRTRVITDLTSIFGQTLYSYYQLTHDYLVSSIREWLTQGQGETWRGRAELRLEERCALWNAKPEDRQLPSLLEWVTIGLLTRKEDWTDSQRRMMRRAGRVHGLWTLATVLVLAGLGIAGLSIRIKMGEANQETQAQGLVQRLLDADTGQVPEIVRSISAYRRWTDPELKKTVAEAADTSRKKLQKLHASLALLPVDANQVDFLFSRLLAASPTELPLPVPVIQDALKSYQANLIPKLWATLESAKLGDVSLLRAASALAEYDGNSPRWKVVGGKVAEALVTVDPVYLGPWIDALLPVQMKLTTPLVTIFHDKNRSEIKRTLATSILKDYASDDPDLLADLLLDSEEKPFAVLFDKLKARQERALPVLEAELAKPSPAAAEVNDQDVERKKDVLAGRQARAAVALIRLGKAEEVWPLMRHSADPRLRSFLVNWLRPLGADPRTLATELNRLDPKSKPMPAQGQQFMDAVLFHPETSTRRALILALGQYEPPQFPVKERDALIENLLGLYEQDPDAGIHGAAEWTLRKWGQQESLKEKDAAMRGKDPGERRWYVNGQGQTFAVIKGPVEFLMGSPPTEPERIARYETPLRVVIPRRFAIADREVTVEQYQRFVKTNPQFGIDPSDLARYSPKGAGPMIGVSWYGAAAYCNWLSEQEGLLKDQWCYLPNRDGAYDAGMSIPDDVLKRTGYRLPTEAEWEYACRSGTFTSRYYGVSTDLLGKYAWYQANSRERAWPGGSLIPNESGLFDMLGNVFEWVQDQHGRLINITPARKKRIIGQAFQPDSEPCQAGKPDLLPCRGNMTDDINKHEFIDAINPRILRGGAFYLSADVRSAFRYLGAPAFRNYFYGFRPSRTYH